MSRTGDKKESYKERRSSNNDNHTKKSKGVHRFRVNNIEFTIDRKYAPIQSLGHGAYGVVCAGINRENNAKVAIKKIPSAFDDLVDAKRILREVKLLRFLRHDNIVNILDIVPPPEGSPLSDIYMVLDFMDADLHKVIYSKNKIEDVHIQYFTYQILKALKYMHSAQVMHRDLKPSNILVNANCELKICDFGLSRGFNRSSGSATNDELTEYVVTRWYRAPEVMTSCSEYNEKIDVWSVGCILAELHGRKPLFPGEDYIRQMNLIFGLLGTPSSHDLKFISNVNALEYIKSLPRKPKIPFAKIYYEHEMNPLAADMLEKMIVFNPLNRMSVEECLKHPYIAGLHNEDNEPVCSAPFDFSFENEKMDKATLQKHMWEEIYHFRPKLKELHEEKGITHQDLTPNKHFNNTPSSTKPKPILQSPASSARKYADISDSMKKLKMRQ